MPILLCSRNTLAPNVRWLLQNLYYTHHHLCESEVQSGPQTLGVPTVRGHSGKEGLVVKRFYVWLRRLPVKANSDDNAQSSGDSCYSNRCGGYSCLRQKAYLMQQIKACLAKKPHYTQNAPAGVLSEIG